MCQFGINRPDVTNNNPVNRIFDCSGYPHNNCNGSGYHNPCIKC